MPKHTTFTDFQRLEEQGLTVIYKESETELKETDWHFWSTRITKEETVYVYRKIVTFEEAEQYEIEKMMNDID